MSKTHDSTLPLCIILARVNDSELEYRSLADGFSVDGPWRHGSVATWGNPTRSLGFEYELRSRLLVGWDLRKFKEHSHVELYTGVAQIYPAFGLCRSSRQLARYINECTIWPRTKHSLRLYMTVTTSPHRKLSHSRNTDEQFQALDRALARRYVFRLLHEQRLRRIQEQPEGEVIFRPR